MTKTRKNQRFLVSRKFVKFSRKSQAALEFLTTYAWAFLVIIIMVGALAYFGVLSPSKLLPDRCNFGSEITCNKDLMVVESVKAAGTTLPADTETETVLGATDTLTMRLENNFGTPVKVKDATITTDITSAGECFALFDKDPAGPLASAIDPGPGGASPLENNPTSPTAQNNLITWNSDETLTFIGRCSAGNALVKKEKVKFNLEIDYYPSSAGPSYTKKIFGEVFTTVQ